MSRTATALSHGYDRVRTRVRREASTRAPLRVLPVEEARHRDIALGNATVQLTDEQLQAAREIRDAQSDPATAHAAR